MKKIIIASLLAAFALIGCKEEKKAETMEAPAATEQVMEEAGETNEATTEEGTEATEGAEGAESTEDSH